jgi:hypothetical protein
MILESTSIKVLLKSQKTGFLIVLNQQGERMKDIVIILVLSDLLQRASLAGQKHLPEVDFFLF